jgi:NCAIR mutase (PurE)-related protein
MDKEFLYALMEKVRGGEVSVEDAVLQLKTEPFAEVEDYAKVDMHRGIRQGVPEVIFGAGKTKEQMLGIAKAMLENGQKSILITRLAPEAAEFLAGELELDYRETSHTGIIGPMHPVSGLGTIVVATGGTSDVPVADEAACAAEFLGNRVRRLYDVGVSGIHRLFLNMDAVMEASVIIAVAGMEGALPSVIGGLADCPVIAVPTSVGYGASFGGLAALLSMLNSCASGVSVVNIDNGFGAGYMAHMINHMQPKEDVLS